MRDGIRRARRAGDRVRCRVKESPDDDDDRLEAQRHPVAGAEIRVC
jgi:hypothetical protein